MTCQASGCGFQALPWSKNCFKHAQRVPTAPKRVLAIAGRLIRDTGKTRYKSGRYYYTGVVGQVPGYNVSRVGCSQTLSFGHWGGSKYVTREQARDEDDEVRNFFRSYGFPLDERGWLRCDENDID